MRSALFAPLIAVLCLMCVSCQTGPYSEIEQWNRPAFYAGVGGLYAAEDFDVDDTPGVDFDDSVGVSGRIGYRFDAPRWFGDDPIFRLVIEGDFNYYDEFDVSPGSGSIDGWSAGVNGKFYPVSTWAQPYALIGVGVLELDLDGAGPLNDDQSEPYVKYGGGMDFYATENSLFFAEVAYNDPTSDLKDFAFWTATVGFAFNLPTRGVSSDENEGDETSP